MHRSPELSDITAAATPARQSPYPHDGTYRRRDAMGTPVLYLPNKEPRPGEDHRGAGIGFDIFAHSHERRWRVVNHIEEGPEAIITTRRTLTEAVALLMEWGLPEVPHELQEDFFNSIDRLTSEER